MLHTSTGWELAKITCRACLLFYLFIYFSFIYLFIYLFIHLFIWVIKRVTFKSSPKPSSQDRFFHLPSYSSELRKIYTPKLLLMCLAEECGSCSAWRGQITYLEGLKGKRKLYFRKTRDLQMTGFNEVLAGMQCYRMIFETLMYN